MKLDSSRPLHGPAFGLLDSVLGGSSRHPIDVLTSVDLFRTTRGEELIAPLADLDRQLKTRSYVP